MNKASIVYNPAARNAPSRERLERGAAAMRSLGWEIELRVTGAAGHATRLAREAAADGASVVFGCGGDGTINEVVNGLVGSEAALGVLRGGMGNVFAKEIGVAKAPEQALRCLFDGQRRRFDLGVAQPLPPTRSLLRPGSGQALTERGSTRRSDVAGEESQKADSRRGRRAPNRREDAPGSASGRFILRQAQDERKNEPAQDEREDKQARDERENGPAQDEGENGQPEGGRGNGKAQDRQAQDERNNGPAQDEREDEQAEGGRIDEGGRYFLLMAGVGFDAEVVRKVPARPKWWLGSTAYVLWGIREMLRYQPTVTRISLEGVERDVDLYWLLVGNTRSYGGVLNIARRALVDDGKLDAYVFEGRGLARTASMAARLALGRQDGARGVVYERVSEIEVPASGLTVQVDGEFIGETPVRFEVAPGAIEVLLPRGGGQQLFGTSGD